MRASFLNEHAFPLTVMGILIAIPLAATLFVACSDPDTPEEKAAYDESYSDRAKEDMITVSPRPGVECYILRGRHNTEPRVMSCVTLPKESN